MSKNEKEPLLDESMLEQLEERLVQRVLSKISASNLPKAGESSSVPSKERGEYRSSGWAQRAVITISGTSLGK